MCKCYADPCDICTLQFCSSCKDKPRHGLKQLAMACQFCGQPPEHCLRCIDCSKRICSSCSRICVEIGCLMENKHETNRRGVRCKTCHEAHTTFACYCCQKPHTKCTLLECSSD